MASELDRNDLEDLLGKARTGALLEDGRPAVLWSADEARVLWVSKAAAELLGATGSVSKAQSALSSARTRIRAFAAQAGAGASGVEALRVFLGSRFVSLDVEHRQIVLASGKPAVATFFGAQQPSAQTAAVDKELVGSETPSAEADETTPAPSVPQAGSGSAEAPTPVQARTTVQDDQPAATAASAVPREPAAAPTGSATSGATTGGPAQSSRPTRPVRFVFQTGPGGEITVLSPGFALATGQEATSCLGQSLATFLSAHRPEAGEQVARAVAQGATWSAVTVDWPSADGNLLIPTEWSGSPILGPDRAVSGFTGFGVCRVDRARARTRSAAPSAPVEAGAAQSPAPNGSTSDGPVESGPGPQVTLANEQGRAPLSVVAERDIATLDPNAAGAKTSLPLGVEPDEADIAAALPEPDLSSAPMPAAGPAGAKPVQDNAPAREFSDERVVSLPNLRGQVGASMAGGNVVPLKTMAETPAAPGLSMTERHAFREIAKALGARFEGSDPHPAPPAPEPERRQKAAEAAAAPEPAPPQQTAPVPSPSREAARVQPPAPVALGDLLVERLPVGVLVFRGQDALYLNRPLLDLAGYADIAEFRALDGLSRLFQARPAPSIGSGEFDTVTIVGRDGQSLPVDAHLQTIDWQGSPATVVSFRRAVDAENGPRVRSLELELKARRSDLAEVRAMLDTATDGVISLDENGRILALNRSAEALFGYDQKELAGERLTLLLAPESHALALDYLDGLKANGVASVLNDGREVMGKERNGGRIPLFMTVGRISETGKFAAVVRDLTAWKRAESELTEAKRAAERASALKSDFLAKISHEIRTPMNAIIGFAEVMRDERLGPIGTERYKEYLKDIHTSGEHVISLVNDLLDLSKIEAGRMDLTFGSVDLNTVVTGCLGIMQPQANRDRVIMRSQLSPKLPPVVADERSIRQIVLNLLSNASKFTEPGGQVIISTALTDAGEAVIRVRDTGIGMTESEVQAALEPFRQLSATRHRGGTGLGLPLTKALVEANRAAFTIRSKSREGTLVEVTFPPTRVLAE